MQHQTLPLLGGFWIEPQAFPHRLVRDKRVLVVEHVPHFISHYQGASSNLLVGVPVDGLEAHVRFRA